MSGSGMGVGSASAVLVFAVLCLTVLALISLSAATADQALTDAAARNVKDYYTADFLAEQILAEILEADVIPDAIRGVDISSYSDDGMKHLRFSCPISERKELYVEAVISGGSCEILKWTARDTGEWEIDEGIPVWGGE